MTGVFFFLYGPVEVALPVHVAQELHGSAGLLGLYWTVFGVGATLGGLGAGLLRHRPPWLVVVEHHHRLGSRAAAAGTDRRWSRPDWPGSRSGA